MRVFIPLLVTAITATIGPLAASPDAKSTRDHDWVERNYAEVIEHYFPLTEFEQPAPGDTLWALAGLVMPFRGGPERMVIVRTPVEGAPTCEIRWAEGSSVFDQLEVWRSNHPTQSVDAAIRAVQVHVAPVDITTCPALQRNIRAFAQLKDRVLPSLKYRFHGTAISVRSNTQRGMYRWDDAAADEVSESSDSAMERWLHKALEAANACAEASSGSTTRPRASERPRRRR